MDIHNLPAGGENFLSVFSAPIFFPDGEVVAQGGLHRPRNGLGA